MNKNSSSLWKIDTSISNKEFFINSLILLVFQIIIIGIDTGVFFLTDRVFIPLTVVFFIISFIPFVYLNFVNCVKRIWNISGYSKEKSLVIGFFIAIITAGSIYIFPLFIILLYFIFVIFPGKKDIVKSRRET